MKIFETKFVRAANNPRHFPKDKSPQIAFSGRSNVGKSSMINCLLSRKNVARVSSYPGKTRSVNFLQINRRFYFVDLPGYGYAKVAKSEREEWKLLIESFLLDNPRLRGLVQIIDARLGVTENDHIMFEFLKNVPFQTLIVATKADKLKKNEIIKQEAAIQKQLEFYSLQNWLFFSAKTKLGKREVWSWLSNRISQ